MARYAYKEVRDLLPNHIIENMGPDYDGDANYDGDMWCATANYIEELIAQRNALQAKIDGGIRVHAVIDWEDETMPYYICCNHDNDEKFIHKLPHNATLILDNPKQD